MVFSVPLWVRFIDHASRRMNGRIAYLIELVFAVAIGYGFAIMLAVLKCKKGDRLRFVKENGFEVSMLAFVGIFGSALATLFLWAGVYFALNSLLGIQFTKTDRFALFGAIYVITYFGCLVYGLRAVMQDDKNVQSSSSTTQMPDESCNLSNNPEKR